MGTAGADVFALHHLMERANRESGYPNAHVYVHVASGAEVRTLARAEEFAPTVLIRVRDETTVSSAEVFGTGARDHTP